jgi:hypothetical protein
VRTHFSKFAAYSFALIESRAQFAQWVKKEPRPSDLGQRARWGGLVHRMFGGLALFVGLASARRGFHHGDPAQMVIGGGLFLGVGALLTYMATRDHDQGRGAVVGRRSSSGEAARRARAQDARRPRLRVVRAGRDRFWIADGSACCPRHLAQSSSGRSGKFDDKAL